MERKVTVIGGGLAGCEAAWQAAERGAQVELFEMRPKRQTPAHKTGNLAELVCSNSLKSESEGTAPWLLKEELRRCGSLLIRCAYAARVPGGHALTVDRGLFADGIETALAGHPRIRLIREPVAELPQEGVTVVASGPLTTDELASAICRETGTGQLFFYDSISPIVDAETIDYAIAFRASRYGKSLDGTDDYVNCPFDRQQYEGFVTALLEANAVASHIDESIPFFEACLPVEELARRGRETLRFGPMKPMGLVDPRTGRRPYAVVQLRQENARAGSYNLVGFQNHLKYGDQAKVLRMIPGLESAEFLRYGQIHRNTYINAPLLLNGCLQLKSRLDVLFAGQISGVEGYTEAIATGLIAGRNAAAVVHQVEPEQFPRPTALGSLCHYLTHAEPAHYAPANITFDLLPMLDDETRTLLRKDKKARHAEVCRRALQALSGYLEHESAATLSVAG